MRDFGVLVEDKGLVFDLKIEDNLPLVRFDRDRITQVLSNLLSNYDIYS